MRLNWAKTFLIGFGFLSVSAGTVLYDSYMPIFYREILGDLPTVGFLVGLLMGVDNFLGFTLQPYMGALSDRTKSSWGRRRPFVLIGLPIAALMTLAIPFAREVGLIGLVAVTILLNAAIAIYRSPVVALMPDMTPAPKRSLANGVINLMGGIGAAVVLLVGAQLYGVNQAYPFYMAGAIMLAVLVLYIFFVREPEKPYDGDADSDDEKPQALLAALRGIIKSPDKTTLTVLFAIFLLFIGYQSINTWFTTFGVQIMGIPENKASGMLTFFAGSFVLGALPAGILGSKFGRRKTIAAGLIGMTTLFMAMQFLYTDLALFQGLLVGAGLCWALVNINTYPMVVQLCSGKQTGAFTGLYYIFAGVAGTFGPSLGGAAFDIMGSYQYLFTWSALFCVAALITISTVKRGEADGTKAA